MDKSEARAVLAQQLACNFGEIFNNGIWALGLDVRSTTHWEAWMIKRVIYPMACALILLFIGCNSHESDILRRIAEASHNGDAIDLRPIADGNWDRLLAFRPYTSKTTIESTIGSPWSGARKIEMRDDIYLLVFVRGDEVVAYASVPRSLAEFNLPDFHEVPEIRRDQAVFEFTGKEKCVALLSSGQRK